MLLTMAAAARHPSSPSIFMPSFDPGLEKEKEEAASQHAKKPKKAKKQRKRYIRVVSCSVCGDIANDHIHYGAIACYSCRAFFRRSVSNENVYDCSRTNTCPVTKETRKHCQACRFQKCKAIGMKPSWVMTEQERKEKRTKVMKEKRELRKGAKRPASTFLAICPEEAELAVKAEVKEEAAETQNEEVSDEEDLFDCRQQEQSQDHHQGEQEEQGHPSCHNDQLRLHQKSQERRQSYQQPQDQAFHQQQQRPPQINPPHRVDVSPRNVYSQQLESPFEGGALSLPPSPPPLTPNSTEKDVIEYFNSAPDSATRCGQLSLSPLSASQTAWDHRLERRFSNPDFAPLSADEQAFLRDLVSREKACRQSLQLRQETLLKYVESAKSGCTIPYDALIDGFSTCVQRISRFMCQLDCFGSLDWSDQQVLLRSNTHSVVNLKSGRMLKPSNDFQGQLSFAMGGGNAPSAPPSPIAPPTDAGPKLRYAQIFTSPWCCSADKEEEFQALMEEIFNLEMDDVVSVVLMIMAMFTPASTLVGAELVAARRQHFSQLLFRYLNDVLGPERRDVMFEKYTRLLAKLQDMAKILKQERLLL